MTLFPKSRVSKSPYLHISGGKNLISKELAAKARENEEQAKHLEHDIRRDLCALDDCVERGERRDGRSSRRVCVRDIT